MRRLPRPRSRGFRAMLGMALLAWAVLASGALVAPLYLSGAMQMDASMQKMVSQTGAPGCEGMPRQPGVSHQMPMPPTGQVDCCHGGCHCLSACNAVLTVPASTVAVPMPSAAVPTIALAGHSEEPAAPPLRPPIA